MYRRLVLSTEGTMGPSVYKVLYRVNGAILLAQGQVSSKSYNEKITPSAELPAIVFDGAVTLKASSWIASYAPYEFILDVSENQPAEEFVEEITDTGVTIIVYNEHGVIVCRNVPKTPAGSSPEQTVVPGEMTSVPGEEPGEMTSEPIDAPAL